MNLRRCNSVSRQTKHKSAVKMEYGLNDVIRQT